MVYRFSQKSEERLKTLHPDMARVVRRALSFQVMDFTVLETDHTGISALWAEQGKILQHRM